MCLVFVDCLVQVLALKFRVFAATEKRHRYKLLTNKYSCIFYENSYIFASSSKLWWIWGVFFAMCISQVANTSKC